MALETIDSHALGVLRTDTHESASWRLLLRRFPYAVWVAKAFFGLFFVSLVLVVLAGLLPIPLTPLMVIRAGEKISAGHWPTVEKTWVPLSQISPQLQWAVIAGEDAKFFDHHGFDWEAIHEAALRNKTSRRGLRGASTISQQTAKNVFLWPKRSWFRKGLETYFTTLIELAWSKRRILEVYLNVVELGDGVYGAEAAAQKYFHKSARELTASEASLMAAVLPNPRRYLIARPSSYVRLRQGAIRRRLLQAAASAPSS